MTYSIGRTKLMSNLFKLMIFTDNKLPNSYQNSQNSLNFYVIKKIYYRVIIFLVFINYYSMTSKMIFVILFGNGNKYKYYLITKFIDLCLLFHVISVRVLYIIYYYYYIYIIKKKCIHMYICACGKQCL